MINYTLESKSIEIVDGKISTLKSEESFTDLLSAHRAMEEAVCKQRKILYWMKFNNALNFLGKIESDTDDYSSTVHAKAISGTSVLVELYSTFEISYKEV